MEVPFNSNPRVCFEFEVEKIIGMSIDGDYQVQWAPAWVSRFHLSGCERLIQEFLEEQAGQEVEGETLDWEMDECTIIENKQGSISKEHVSTSGRDSAGLAYGSTECHYEYQSSKADSNNLSTDELQQNHSQPQGSYSKQNSSKVVSELDAEEPKHKCNTCVAEFLSENELTAHLMCHTNGESRDQSNEQSHPKHSMAQKGNQHNQPKTVNQIDKSLHLTRSIAQKGNQHQRPKTSNQIAKPSCSMRSMAQSKKRRNRRKTGDRSKNQSYSCDHCGYKCKSNTDMVKHLRTHTGEKPFPCNACGRSFARKDNLERHVRHHKNVKLYRCEVCQKMFTDSDTRMKHVKDCLVKNLL